MIKSTLLWPTPVWEIETPELLRLTVYIKKEVEQFYQETGSMPSNIFNVEKPNIQLFKSVVLSHVSEVISESELYNNAHSPQMSWGIYNVIQSKVWDTPHCHPLVNIVGVFYIKANQDHPDLYMIPNSSMSGFNGSVDDHNHNKTSRMYHKIKCKTGKLVLFPGDVMHFVPPNESVEDRIALSLNMTLNFK